MNNDFIKFSGDFIINPSEPGNYLLLKIKNNMIIDLWLKTIICIKEQLFVKDYLNTESKISLILPPVSLNKFNKPEYRWLLIQPDVTKMVL